MLRREVDETLQIGDGTVDKDAVGIVAGGMCGKNSIGTCGEYENVVGEGLAGGCLNGLGDWGDLGDSGAEMVVEGALLERSVLRECIRLVLLR